MSPNLLGAVVDLALGAFHHLMVHRWVLSHKLSLAGRLRFSLKGGVSNLLAK
jgi:hypothetical protein